MSWPERLMQILTIRCQATSALVSRDRDERLPLPERLAMQGHLVVCRSCRRLHRQVAFLHQALRAREEASPGTNAGAERLSAEARGRIVKVLSEAATEPENGPA